MDANHVPHFVTGLLCPVFIFPISTTSRFCDRSNLVASRVATDASKARKNIRQQVNRDIDRIRTFSSELADHLRLAFLSDAMCFLSDAMRVQPDHDPQWQF